jgi:hypothetical protein
MTADLALERTRPWKRINADIEFIPEWLTEFYLMEEQLKYLMYPPSLPKKLNLCPILRRIFKI